jgi:phage/plasmid primase, P4 family, C-terminal domain
MSDITQYEPTEFGMAQLFVDIFGEGIRHVILEKHYYVYKPKKGIWLQDQEEFVERYMERFLSEVCLWLISQIENVGQRRRFRAWIDKRQSNAAVNNILKSVRRKPGITINSTEFDKQARYFKLKNCVFDFGSSECISDDKNFLITKEAGARYDAEVKDNTWRDFMMSIMDNDEEMYDYLLRTILYAMQGNPVYHCMFMLLGLRQRNGKSTFVGGLSAFFGRYGTSLLPESLAKTRVGNGDSPSPDIAKLKGARFVSIAEPAKKITLNVALIKAITGMDIISARKLYSNYEDFVNHAVFFMHMNRLPVVDDPTLFGGERVIVIPFDVHFEEADRDTQLPKKLVTDGALSGLLNEVLRIQKKYKGVGVKERLPKKIQKATKDFEYKCDPISHFMRKFFVRGEGLWIPMSEIYKRYKKFAFEMGIIPIASRSLTIELKERGYDIKRRGKGGNGLKGYSWK